MGGEVDVVGEPGEDEDHPDLDEALDDEEEELAVDQDAGAARTGQDPVDDPRLPLLEERDRAVHRGEEKKQDRHGARVVGDVVPGRRLPGDVLPSEEILEAPAHRPASLGRGLRLALEIAEARRQLLPLLVA